MFEQHQTVRNLDTWSRWTIVLAIVALPLMIYAALGAKVGSASAHAWLPEGRAERHRYEEFVAAFGSDQYLIASWDGCRIDDERLVAFVETLHKLDDPQNPLLETVQTSRDIVRSLTDPPLALSLRAAQARLEGSLIGRDGTAAIFIRFTPHGVAEQKDSITFLRQAADRVDGLGHQALHMVGSVYEAYAVDDAAERSLRRLVIPSSLLGIVLAWLCLRSVRAAVAVLIVAGIGQLLAVALVSVTGGEFSAVLIVLPTLVFMLTLSAAVHFMNYYSDVAYSHQKYLGARAILLGLKPSVLATVTTSLGMIALATSQLAPVRTFGIYSATALCLATLFLLLSFPKVADWFCRSQVLEKHRRGELGRCEEDDGAFEHTAPVAPWAKRYAAWSKRNCLVVSTLGIALLLFSFYGLLHLKSSTKFDEMFPKGSQTVRDMAWFESHLGPIASVEVMIKFAKTHSIEDYDQIEWVHKITQHLRAQKDIGGVTSATTFLPKLPASGKIRDVAKRSVYRAELPKSFPMLKERGLLAENDAFQIWRITAKVSALSKLDYGQLTSRVSEATLSVRGDDANAAVPFVAEFTGLSPIMHDTQLALLDDLGSSFTTAFLLITPVMMLIARGVRLGLLIMIPNVLPETLVFGGMAWLGYSIDIAGILTASVAMGIAVNDTLHFVNWYSRRLSMGDTREQAIADTFSNCAKAMIHTMLISCCSMLPFMFAEFNPTRQFAILMIAMMSSSILGDLVLLPALLLSPIGKVKLQKAD